MRSGRGLGILCILVFLFFSCEDKSIKVGIIGDQFGAYDAEKAFNILEDGVIRLKNMSPDIVLHVGDMLESKRDIKNFEDYKKNYETAMSIMGNFESPWLLALGDHEVVPEGFKALSEDRSREKWCMDLIKTSNLPIKDKPYYSYTYKDYHFVVLYSMENLHTDPRWGSIFLNKINNEQLEWLKEDLKKNSTTNGTIVLVHHPHWYVWQNWKPVHDLLKEYNTHAVIAGHYHYDQDEGELDGIRYLVMGSSGGVIKEADKNTSSQEIAMLRISPKGIEDIKLYDIEDGKELEWTPRVSMDRVQALSCMLDNLWQDVSLYSKDGKIYSMNHNEVNKVDLESLVNPIDIPIKIHISVPEDICSDPVWLIDGKNITQDTITFAPAYRSGSANYSTVRNWFPPPSVWETSINNSKLAENSALSFRIYVSFEDSMKREIAKTLTYYIAQK